MGKEADLLKAVKDRDIKKVQKLLSASVKRTEDESLCWQSGNQNDKIRVELRHININVVEANTEYTPLHLAILQGVKDIAERLIFNCANVNARDAKGNSPLHLAVFQGREDLVELLLFNDAEVNEENKDGNTPLHIACESGEALSNKIIKRVIKAGAVVWTQNKYKYSPLDVAAMYGKNEHVKTLLEYAPTLTANRTALIEASIRGHASTVELLLDCGVEVNEIDENHGSTALHEAVRFLRFDVVKVLLCYGAETHLVNLRRESPQSIAEVLPSTAAEQMKQCFEDSVKNRDQSFKPQQKLVKNVTNECEYSVCRRVLPHIKSYPDIPTDITWTQNRPTFCSTCTEKNPNSHILDGNPRTMWVIPVLHNAWTILDLHSEHIISGITIYGWNSPQMLKTFQLQTSDTFAGPWTTITTHTCQLLGSSDPKQNAFPQKFEGFTFQSRFIRLYLVDNHGGSYICFQGIQLHGADCQVIDALNNCDLSHLADDVIKKGMNSWKSFLDFPEEELDAMVSDPLKKASLLQTIYKARKEMYPLTYLKWVTPPITSVFVDEILPEFSVQADAGVTEVIHLVVQGGQIEGDVCQRLVPQGEGKPSLATFTSISIKPAGLYCIMVKNDPTDIKLVAPHPTEVRLEVKTESDISSAFDEIQDMLSKVQASLN